MVRSAVGSTIVKVVSKSSAVAPSNITAFAAFIVTVSTCVVVPVTVRLPETVKFCAAVTLPLESMVMADVAEATPIVPPSLITRSPATWKSPIELSVALAVAEDAAVSETPVVNTNLVALASAAKVPSAIA